MSYGARAQRVPALGGAVLKDIDIFKILLLGQTERGIVDGSDFPVIMDEIYSMNDFSGKCGEFNNSYMAAYVADSFYKELDKNISCEMKVLSYVDAGAVQAVYDILDSAPLKIFDCDAAYKGLTDKSAFGNKIAIKTTKTNNVTMKLTADVLTGVTVAYLDNVDNLQVGYYVKFVGAVTAMAVVTSISTSAKSIGFSALTLGATLEVASTVVSRADVKLEIAIKDSSGNYQRKELWEAPFAKSNTVGLALLVNDSISGSEYIKLTINAANTTPALTQLPADLTSWTPLTSGSDGTAANDAAWNTLATTYLNSTEFTIMLAPESATITHNTNMANFCTSNYKGMFYAQAADASAEASLKNFGASLRGSVVFAMLPSDKWINVVDPTVIGGFKHIPKVGVDASHWFNTYNKFGEAKVAAGNKSEMVLKCTDQLLDSNGLVHDDQDGVGSRLIKNYSVNICRYRRGKGITNNSARTFSTDAGYMYQNQIMQFLLYSRSIVTYLREVEQDKAGKAAQNSHYNTVWGYMKKKFDSGQLFVGQKEDGTETGFNDVCLIINDFSINTLADIANGIEQIFFQFVAVPPIEELILSVASAPVTSVRG
jgi:hypothetical protein